MKMQNKDKTNIKENIKQFLNKVDSEFIEIQGGSFVYLETGEFFTKAEHDKYIQRKLETYKTELFAEINLTIKTEKGIENEQALVNRRSKTPKKTKPKTRDIFDCGDKFNIVFRDRIEEVISMKLTANEKLTFYVLRDFAQFPTNCVIINEHVPSFKELEPLVSLSEKSIRTAVKTLEDKGLIKRFQYGHKKAIYINPQYYATGKELDLDTLKMFGLLECDDNKVEEYLNY
jgi:DNA-binding HxlR family transcriptional regulator/chaperonin cofactor prefoldin